MQPGMEIVNYKWCTFQCLISKYENLAGKKDDFGKKKSENGEEKISIDL